MLNWLDFDLELNRLLSIASPKSTSNQSQSKGNFKNCLQWVNIRLPLKGLKFYVLKYSKDWDVHEGYRLVFQNENPD